MAETRLTKKEAKERSKGIEPTVRIGKNGLTDVLVLEIKKQLKARQLVKIKYLRSFIAGGESKGAQQKIASLTGAVIVDSIGFTVTISRKDKIK